MGCPNHPEDRTRVVAERNSFLERGGTFATECRICRPDGAERWITIRYEKFPGRDGEPVHIICAQRDITEIVAVREAQESRAVELESRIAERTAALARAEARFRAIFDSQFQMIGLLDPDGTVLEANQTACTLAGITRDAFVGRRFWDGFEWSETERDRLRREVAEATNGVMIRREVELIDADGRGIWIDFSLKPVRDPTMGTVIWIIPEGRDITEQRSLSAQLLQARRSKRSVSLPEASPTISIISFRPFRGLLS